MVGRLGEYRAAPSVPPWAPVAPTSALLPTQFSTPADLHRHQCGTGSILLYVLLEVLFFLYLYGGLVVGVYPADQFPSQYLQASVGLLAPSQQPSHRVTAIKPPRWQIDATHRPPSLVEQF